MNPRSGFIRAAALLALTFPAVAHCRSDPVDRLDSRDFHDRGRTMGTVAVGFTGNINPAAQTSGGTNYWARP